MHFRGGVDLGDGFISEPDSSSLGVGVLLVVLMGCGSATPTAETTEGDEVETDVSREAGNPEGTEPEASESEAGEPEASEPGTPLQVGPVTLEPPPTTADEVRATVNALALLEGRPRPSGSDACFMAAEVAWSRDIALPRNECLTVEGFGFVHPGVRLWSLLRNVDGAIHHVGTVQACTQPGPCPAPPDRDLARQGRCTHLDRIWNRVPEAHRRCGVDTDCGIVGGAGNCLHVGLNVGAVPAYERYRDEHDVPCQYGAAGMCPGEGPTVSCVEGICRLSNEHF